MLATCNRCQSRKIKCDSLLSGCQPCTQAGIDCMFHDYGSQTDVSRSYVAKLDDRVRRLRAKLGSLKERSEHPLSSPTETHIDLPPRQNTTIKDTLPCIYYDGSLDDACSLRLVLGSPEDASSSLFLGSGTAAIIGALAFKNAFKLGLKQPLDSFKKAEIKSLIPHIEASKLDRSVVSIAAIREIIDRHYLVKIHSLYPIVDLNDLKGDLTHLNRIPIRRRFVIIMAAAISSASLAKQHPALYTNAIILRHWADELAVSVLSDPGAPRLQEVLLLVIYELVDPTRRLIWHLLGLACRMCVMLGWHRNAGAIATAESGQEGPEVLREQERRTVLFIVLYECERRVCHALGRPTILPDISINLTLLPPLQELGKFQNLFTQSQLRHKIYEATPGSCPFSAEIVDLIHRQLDGTEKSNTSWLMLYPTYQHSCTLCFTTERWEREIEQAAISTIDCAYDLYREQHIVSIWLATSEVFTAGAILLDISMRQKLAPGGSQFQAALFKSCLRCMSLLSSFAESWLPAQAFRDAFEKLLGVVSDS